MSKTGWAWKNNGKQYFTRNGAETASGEKDELEQ
jgi:hypothetical protein